MTAWPLVSCIMPTANRRAFVPRAIQYFLRQDYPRKELVILDDGDDSVADLIPVDPRIRYLRETRRRSVGAKRNALCEEARGELVAHWDDDDWYPHGRLSRQAQALGASGCEADVSGSSRLYFLDSQGGQGWEYHYRGPRQPYVLGSTMVYRRDLWRRNPFPDRRVGEDAAFVWSAAVKRVLDLADPGLCVAAVHPHNTSPKRPEGCYWKPVDAGALRRLMETEEVSLVNAPARLSDSAIPETAAQVADRLPGLSVVIPHAGRERLPQLGAALACLAQHRDIDELIVVELGTQALARAAALRWGARYVFVRHAGPFARARALNVGTALAVHSLVLWQDNDLLLPPGFAGRARAELERQGLDFLIPYVRIHYLSESDSREVMRGTRAPTDCAPAEVWRGGVSSGGSGLVRCAFVARVGGLDEQFQDWGYEDTAWWYKARLLGRTAVTQDAAQVLHHLYHRPARCDPARFAANQARCRQQQAIGSAAEFLTRFPPPARASCPWPPDRRILMLAEPPRRRLAQGMANALRETFGADCTAQDLVPGAAPDPELHAAPPDALVVFGDAPANRLLAGASLAALAKRTLILVDSDAAGGAAATVTAAAGARRWALSTAPVGEPVPLRQALACAVPLSEVLGAPLEPAAAEGLAVWTYWEGPCPDWIDACLQTLRAQAPTLRILDPAGFEALRSCDRDIDLGRLHVAHRADFIRAYLLAHVGGLWIDADCLLMRPPTEVFERLETHEFIAHQDRQGWFPNGFMAARPGSRIARALYDRICERLRSGVTLGWTSLGGEPLTQILRTTDAPWFEMECRNIQPVCWSTPGVFFDRAADREHARHLETDALCYMLSNTEVRKYLDRNPGADLLGEGTFFRFLLGYSLGEAAAPAGTAKDAPLAAVVPFMLGVLDAISPARVLQVGTDSVLWGALVREWWRARAGAGGPPGHLAALRLVDGEEVAGLDLFDHVERNVQSISEAAGGDWCLILLTGETVRLPRTRLDSLLRQALAAGGYVLIPAAAETLDADLEALQARVVLDAAGDASGVATDSSGLLLTRADPRALMRPSRAGLMFERWFQDALARGDESVSGPGSSLAQTAELRQRLPLLLAHLRARSMLDAPCGDFHWMQHVTLGIDDYVGVDVVPTLIACNAERHAGPRRRFAQRDILRDLLPAADVILCRDCLVHLGFAEIRRVVRNFQRSGSRYLLTTTFSRVTENRDCETGGWRPLNLEQAPFQFPPPLALINEKCTEGQGRYADKSLGLWRLRDL